MGELDNNNSNYPEHTRKGKDLLPCFWCEDNGIEIGPQYHYKNGISEWKVQIKIGNKINVDPNIYDKKDIMDKIYEYCDYYYNKYKI
tara:strand:- start:521 stop:781 length:261 start_codon:yes stop_codon:yes gene_type:complete